MAALLTNQNTDAKGTGVQVNGPCTVILKSNSVIDGATVLIQISDDNVDANFTTPDDGAKLSVPSAVSIQAQGQYFVRAVQKNSGPLTNINCVVNQ